MQAIGYQQPGSIDRDQALVDIELPVPTPEGRDILVRVEAISVNPVDTKVRQTAAPENGDWKVIGWDASGVVTATGSDVTLLKPGDEVFMPDQSPVLALTQSITWSMKELLDLSLKRSTGRLPLRYR